MNSVQPRTPVIILIVLGALVASPAAAEDPVTLIEEHIGIHIQIVGNGLGGIPPNATRIIADTRDNATQTLQNATHRLSCFLEAKDAYLADVTAPNATQDFLNNVIECTGGLDGYFALCPGPAGALADWLVPVVNTNYIYPQLRLSVTVPWMDGLQQLRMRLELSPLGGAYC